MSIRTPEGFDALPRDIDCYKQEEGREPKAGDTILNAPSDYVPSYLRKRTPRRAKKFSYSEIRSYKTCRQRWHYSYQRRIEKVRDASPRLKVGTAVHLALAAHYQCYDYSKAIRNWLNESIADLNSEEEGHDERVFELWGIADLAGDIVLRFLRDDPFKKCVILAVEQEFNVYIPGLGVLNGYWDLIIRDPAGLVWLVDYKTRSSGMRSDVELQLDTQVGIYEFAARECGFPIAGTLFVQIYGKPLGKPKLLKSGIAFSTAKNQNIDPIDFETAIKGHGFNVDEYDEFLDYLRSKEYVRLTRIPRNPNNAVFVAEMRSLVREMRRKNVPLFKQESVVNCPSCEFRDLCVTAHSSGDVEATIDLLYRDRSRRKETYEEEFAPIDEEVKDFLGV